MKAVLTTLIVALSITSTAKAADSCPIDQNDPFAKEAVMPGGTYAGHCIDSSKFRSSRRLTPEERVSFGVSTDESIEAVANFHHQDKYWVALIPKSRVTEVDFMFIPLFGNQPLFHGQLRFRMAPEGPAVQLVEQTNKTDRETITLNEDILFAEYGVRAADKSQDFSMVKGLTGAYAVSYALESLSQGTANDLKERPDIIIRQYKLNLDRAASIDALTSGINVGTELGISRVYNTLTQSCINAGFLVLNRSMEKPEAPWLARASESIHPVGELKRMQLIYRNGASRIENYTGLTP
jgi:hypothetical protein